MALRKLVGKQAHHAIHVPDVCCLAALAADWLRAKESKIKSALWAYLALARIYINCIPYLTLLTHSLTDTYDQLRVVARSTKSDPGLWTDRYRS